MSPYDEGVALLADGEWAAARTRFEQAVAESDDAAAHDGLAQAAWWMDDGETAVAARGRAYRAYRESGDVVAAAIAAMKLARDSVVFGAGSTVGLGWMGRARSLLEPAPEGAAHGWLAVYEAEFALDVHRDPEQAVVIAERAEALGRAHGDHDLELVGTALAGVALVQTGDIPGGLARLDEATAAAAAGDVGDAYWRGKVCCFLISACALIRDVTRASDWCRQVESLCERLALEPLYAVCRTQYAAMLVERGTWKDAEAELRAVMARVAGTKRAVRGEGIVQLAELRRRQGRLDDADALYREVEFHPVSIVGRAEILLARGDAAGAWAALRAELARREDAGRLARLGALEPGVRAAHAAGAHDAAAALAHELRALAEAIHTDAVLASASYAEGVIAPTPAKAAMAYGTALRHAVAAGLVYDAARARLALAGALLADEPRAAAEHLTQATRELAELDARVDLRAAHALGAKLKAPTGPLTRRELEVLRLVAAGQSNPQIAATLVVSEHTVHRHVANILRKLDERNRASAVAKAHATGLL